ncbi:unnamed protein product, partial [Brenthis ino]
MFTLIFFCLIGISLGVPFNSEKSTYSNEHYVLPGESRPTLYDISLFFDPSNGTSFLGNVSIRIIPERNTQQIVLHAMEMQITRIELYSEASQTENLMRTYSLTNDTQFLTVESNTLLLQSQVYILKVEYVGTYSRNMFGVYVSNYQYNDQSYNLVTSQLQPTYARSAFPCYDEPHLKAIFRTTIYAPPQYLVVRSNMPLRNDTSKPDVPGYVRHEFEDTYVMSTYLIAFLVSNFEYITNEPVNAQTIYPVPFRIYSRRGTQNTAEFALNFGQQNMKEFQNYIQFPYALPKIDKVAVPDFAAGAMENWGLVIYREVALLVQEGVTTTATRQNIGRIICHENMHMWFGNEVSPQSWTYTWLNEGFANFFENFGTDLVYPTWRMMDQYVLAMQNVMQSDAVLSVNPMTHPVFTPSEIIGTFNAVAYQKSGSVIRMMQHFLTPEIFRNGLIIYIRANFRQYARPSNLYQALQEALDASSHNIAAPIAIIMQRWTEQGGFPVLTVRRSSPSAQSISVHQERYLTDPSLSSTDNWHVPFNWVLSTNPDFTDTSPQAWLFPGTPALAVDIPGFNQSEWYIVNKQQTGYYRVNYDEANWRALANVLQRSHGTIHLLNRAQIIDDSFNLARNGRLEYDIAFEVSRYLINETDYIPWGAANAAFSYLDIVLSGSEAYRLFQQHVLTLTAPLYDQLGFIAGSGEEHVTPFHRNIILDYNCRYGNQQCVSRSQELLQQLRDNPNQPLNPDVQTVVFCSGLRGGSADNFYFLWDRYSASQDSSERSTILNALGCTSNATLREFFLNQVLDDNSPVRDQDRHSIIVSTINASPENMEAALDFVIENFARIQPRVQMLTGTTNILNAFSRRLSTSVHSVKIDWLVGNHTAIFSAGERAAIAGIRENIGASIAWSEKNYNLVNSWLNDNYGDDDGPAVVDDMTSDAWRRTPIHLYLDKNIHMMR